MTASRAAAERKVRDLLKDVAPSLADVIETIDPDARIWETVDSLSLLDLLASLEDHFRIVIEPVDVIPDNFRTIGRISDFVARCVAEQHPSPDPA